MGTYCHPERGCWNYLCSGEMESRHPPGWNDSKGGEELGKEQTEMVGVNRSTVRGGRYQPNCCLKTDLAAYNQNWEMDEWFRGKGEKLLGLEGR